MDEDNYGMHKRPWREDQEAFKRRLYQKVQRAWWRETTKDVLGCTFLLAAFITVVLCVRWFILGH